MTSLACDLFKHEFVPVDDRPPNANHIVDWKCRRCGKIEYSLASLLRPHEDTPEIRELIRATAQGKVLTCRGEIWELTKSVAWLASGGERNENPLPGR